MSFAPASAKSFSVVILYLSNTWRVMWRLLATARFSGIRARIMFLTARRRRLWYGCSPISARSQADFPASWNVFSRFPVPSWNANFSAGFKLPKDEAEEWARLSKSVMARSSSQAVGRSSSRHTVARAINRKTDLKFRRDVQSGC